MADHVLVPMDTSEMAARALSFALEEHPDATITVVHVINPLEDAYMTGDDDLYAQFSAMEAVAKQRAAGLFEDVAETAAAAGREVDTELVIGHPARMIVEVAENRDVDQIVIGSHGRSGVSRILLGSVAEAVSRRSPVPVTIVK